MRVSYEGPLKTTRMSVIISKFQAVKLQIAVVFKYEEMEQLALLVGDQLDE